MGELTVLNLNDLKQVFFEEEQQTNTSKAELDKAKFELAKAKEQRAKQQQKQKLKLLQAKEQRQQKLYEQKLKQAQKQQKTDNITYIISIGITFLSILTSFILFMTILLKG